MTTATGILRFELLPGAVRSLRIEREQALTVEHAAGTSVWLTRDGEPHDYWLAAGERIALRKGERITLSVNRSDEAACISLAPAGVRAGMPWRRAAAALAAALRPRPSVAGACATRCAPL